MPGYVVTVKSPIPLEAFPSDREILQKRDGRAQKLKKQPMIQMQNTVKGVTNRLSF